jgi:hypothetical protein
MNRMVFSSSLPPPPGATPVQPARAKPTTPAMPSAAICRDFFIGDFLVVKWDSPVPHPVLRGLAMLHLYSAVEICLQRCRVSS